MTTGRNSAIAAGAIRTCCRSSSAWSATTAARTRYRGRSGLLRVTDTPRHRVPLLEMIIEAAQQIGLPFNPDQNGASQEGVGMSQVTIARGRRQSTAYCYLDPARGRENFLIEQGALAESLMLEGKRCVGVRYSVNGAPREARASREVIVSRRLDQFTKTAGAVRHRPAGSAAFARHHAAA